MRMIRIALMTLLLTIVPATPSFAHHAISAVFDTSKTVTLKGIITKVDWRVPHAALSLDVRDAATGKVTNWFIEMAGIGNLAKAGLDQSLFDLSKTYSVEV